MTPGTRVEEEQLQPIFTHTLARDRDEKNAVKCGQIFSPQVSFCGGGDLGKKLEVEVTRFFFSRCDSSWKIYFQEKQKVKVNQFASKVHE